MVPDRLARPAVPDEEDAALVARTHQLAPSSLEELRARREGVVGAVGLRLGPGVVLVDLAEPADLARLRVHGHDRVRQLARLARVVVAGGEVERVQLRIDGEGAPDGDAIVWRRDQRGLPDLAPRLRVEREDLTVEVWLEVLDLLVKDLLDRGKPDVDEPVVVRQPGQVARLRILRDPHLPDHLAGVRVQSESVALHAGLEEHPLAEHAGAGKAVPGPVLFGLLDLLLPDHVARREVHRVDVAAPVREEDPGRPE
jgi:hypothetical protein